METLTARVLAYCQHLPPEERTFYSLAAGHSKVGSCSCSCSCPRFCFSFVLSAPRSTCVVPVASRFRRFGLPLPAPFVHTEVRVIYSAGRLLVQFDARSYLHLLRPASIARSALAEHLFFQRCCVGCFLCVLQPVTQPTGDASPWCFEQLCRAAAAGGSGTTASGGLASPKSNAASRMLSRLSRDDIALLARYLVRTKRAVEEDGVLKVIGRGADGGVGGHRAGRAAAAGESSTAISETEKDLLRLRCTGEEFPRSAVHM